jgi:hypothetical protein
MNEADARSAEVLAAFYEYARRGVGVQDWAGWGALFTDDGVYLEHGQQLAVVGPDAISAWIVNEMERYRALSLWIEWAVIDGDRAAFYIWNNLPALEGSTARFAFPNTTILEYGADGRWAREIDHYNPADPPVVFRAWADAGGRRKAEPDWSLQGISGWAPRVWGDPPRRLIEAAFERYADALRSGARTGDWSAWVDALPDTATRYDHALGRAIGREAARAWTAPTNARFRPCTIDVGRPIIGDGRAVALVTCTVEPPPGDDAARTWDMCLILQLGPHGVFEYEEAVYNPLQAQPPVSPR